MGAFEEKYAAGKAEFDAIHARIDAIRADVSAIRADVHHLREGVAAFNAKLTMLAWIVGANTAAIFGAAMKIIFG